MAIIKSITSNSFVHTINYVCQPQKTNPSLIYGLNCSASSDIAKQEWQALKKYHKNTKGKSCFHFVQSWHKDDNVTPAEVNAMGVEWVQKNPLLADYQVLIVTHIDQKHGNLHNHILVNSVNMRNGKKLHLDNTEYKKLREINDNICKQHGLIVTEKGKSHAGKKIEIQITTQTRALYSAIGKDIVSRNSSKKRYISWVYKIYKNLINAMNETYNKNDFCKQLQKNGIDVNWQEGRKNITFIDTEGHKIREKRLATIFNLDFDIANRMKAREEFCEQQAREQALREQRAREQALREQRAREQALREQQAREARRKRQRDDYSR